MSLLESVKNPEAKILYAKAYKLRRAAEKHLDRENTKNDKILQKNRSAVLSRDSITRAQMYAESDVVWFEARRLEAGLTKYQEAAQGAILSRLTETPLPLEAAA